MDKHDKARRRRLRIVTTLTASRAVMAVLLIPCGLWDLWGVALALFGLAFLTDMLDGALARHWRVQSANGAKLDQLCDALLTMCAVATFVASGMVPWWLFVVLALAYEGTRSLEKKLRGKWLTALIVIVPVVNLTLMLAFTLGFVRLALHTPYPMTIVVLGVAAYALALLKQERIRDYLAMAVQRGNDARRSK